MSGIERDNPVLFLRVGTMASAPEGFCSDLAEMYDAQVWSADRIARGMSRENGQKAGGRRLRHHLDGLIFGSLSRGNNVVCEGFANLYRIREEKRRLVAPIGATIVLLAFETPRQKVIERITRSYKDDEGRVDTVTKTLVVGKKVKIADAILSRIEWPADHGEDHLLLDGSQRSEALLAEVDQYVDRLRAPRLPLLQRS